MPPDEGFEGGHQRVAFRPVQNNGRCKAPSFESGADSGAEGDGAGRAIRGECGSGPGIGKILRAHGGENRHDDRAPPLVGGTKESADVLVEGPGLLAIGQKRRDVVAQPGQFARKVVGERGAVKIEQRPFGRGKAALEERGEPPGRAGTGDGLVTRLVHRRRRALADGEDRHVPRHEPREGRQGIAGGEDGGPGALVEARRQGRGGDSRKRRHADLGPGAASGQVVVQPTGEAAGRRFGPGDENEGLCGCGLHRKGVSWPRPGGQAEAGMRRETKAPAELIVLGIESSCDETAAGVVRVRPADGPRGEILANVVASQTELHAPFGGVVPEIAARAHAERLEPVTREALNVAGIALEEVDLIAVTAGPGLIGGVLSGVMFAKGLVAATGKPLVGVNHLAGHALTVRLASPTPFPYLLLLVSGGHCQFLAVRGPRDFLRLGGTIDDAPGEAFDKVARLVGLPQPGGPHVERVARRGDAARFAFPRPLLDRDDAHLSFSGLKTAVLRARDRLLAEQGGLTRQDQADLAASFQAAVRDVLAEKSRRALALFEERLGRRPSRFAVAGGVAANESLRAALEEVAARAQIPFDAPPLPLCTDNGAMIAWAGAEWYLDGRQDDPTLAARPRWPLDETSPALLGAGRKGAKA